MKTVFDANGNFKAAPLNDLSLGSVVTDGCIVVDGHWLNHYWDGGVREIPPPPSHFHVWDIAARRWNADSAAAWESIRHQRNLKLTACDWTQLPDVPIPTKEAWAAYRQALRDITKQPDPFNIVWPAEPSVE